MSVVYRGLARPDSGSSTNPFEFIRNGETTSDCFQLSIWLVNQMANLFSSSCLYATSIARGAETSFPAEPLNHQSITQFLLRHTGRQPCSGGKRREGHLTYSPFTADSKPNLKHFVWGKRLISLNGQEFASDCLAPALDVASFQLSCPARSAMGAHSWPQVFSPWQTAISQSSTTVLFTSLSPEPQVSLQPCRSRTDVVVLGHTPYTHSWNVPSNVPDSFFF